MMKPEKIIVDTLAASSIPQKAWPWIAAQAGHETATGKGPFTSRVFIANNNFFGMKYPSRRKTTAAGPGTRPPGSEGATPYAKYNTLADSVKDLELWFKFNRVNWNNINSETDYANFLFRKGYFGDKLENYLKGLRYWITRIKLPPVTVIGPTVIIAALALYFILK